jgi:hypothetical protein
MVGVDPRSFKNIFIKMSKMSEWDWFSFSNRYFILFSYKLNRKDIKQIEKEEEEASIP